MNRPIQRADYKDQNIKEASRLIREATKEGAQIICTYEQFLDGYGFGANKIPSLQDPNIERCENIETSKYLQALKDLSAELRITIVAGIAIKEECKTYNSALIFDPSGNLIGRYRKTHNAGKYATWFAPLTTEQQKDNCPSFDIGPRKISIKICNDLHFRQTTTYMMQNDCELLLCPAFGKYDPSSLKKDSAEFGIWAVFIHPQGCQFINNGTIIAEQKAVKDKGSFALYKVAFKKNVVET